MNLADFRPKIGQELNMSDKKAVIKNADMSEEMQQVKKTNRLCSNYWNTFISQLDFFTLGCSGLCN